MIGWLAAAGRAAEVRAFAILLRVTLLILPPSLAHLWLLLCQPRRYRRHRHAGQGAG